MERLKPVKDEFPTLTWPELIDKAFDKNVDLAATYMYKPTDLKDYNIWAAACCEVDVDLLTGTIQLKRVDIMEDVGESLSPGVDVGQIEGAFVMGSSSTRNVVSSILQFPPRFVQVLATI